MDPACSVCGGACCRVVSLPLPPPPLVEGANAFLSLRGKISNGRWFIESTCPKLDACGVCTIYDAPERPKVCDAIPVGDVSCRDAIQAHLEPAHAARVVALLPNAP
jgi:Fe-S-cluster containining protein